MPAKVVTDIEKGIKSGITFGLELKLSTGKMDAAPAGQQEGSGAMEATVMGSLDWKGMQPGRGPIFHNMVHDS